MLSVLLTEPGLQEPPHDAASTACYLDTGFAGELFCWRSHLLEAGLNPDLHRYRRRHRLRATLHADKPVLAASRRADLWLVSNIDALHDHPYRIGLQDGIVFRDEEPPTNVISQPKAIIGMKLLTRLHARLNLDCARQLCSLWLPTPLS